MSSSGHGTLSPLRAHCSRSAVLLFITLSTCAGQDKQDKTNLTFRKHLFPVLWHHSMAIIIIIPVYARHRDRIPVSKAKHDARHALSHPEREVGVNTRVLATVAERVHVVRRSSFPQRHEPDSSPQSSASSSSPSSPSSPLCKRLEPSGVAQPPVCAIQDINRSTQRAGCESGILHLNDDGDDDDDGMPRMDNTTPKTKQKQYSLEPSTPNRTISMIGDRLSSIDCATTDKSPSTEDYYLPALGTCIQTFSKERKY